MIFPFSPYAGFTLIELLVVIAVIGLLAAYIIVNLVQSREHAYLARAHAETRSIGQAIELYYSEHDDYPADVSRGLPNGLEEFLGSGDWPKGPWPGSEYDWDHWDDPDTGEKIYQISIRFCPIGGDLSQCRFPNQIWAENFNVNSAVYYCLAGECRAHISNPVDYPGYCLNCDGN